MANTASGKKDDLGYQRGIFNRGRGTILAILLFSVANLVFIAMDSGTYFLFSASVPYYLTLFGMVFDEGVRFGPYTNAALVISAVILVIYLVAWLMSKKHSGWLIAAAVFFTLDTLVLLYMAFFILDDPAVCITDMIFHGLALWQLIAGSIAGHRCKILANAAQPDPDAAPVPAPDGYRGTTPDLDA